MQLAIDIQELVQWHLVIVNLLLIFHVVLYTEVPKATQSMYMYIIMNSLLVATLVCVCVYIM